jgi:hypothetical protein
MIWPTKEPVEVTIISYSNSGDRLPYLSRGKLGRGSSGFVGVLQRLLS